MCADVTAAVLSSSGSMPTLHPGKQTKPAGRCQRAAGRVRGHNRRACCQQKLPPVAAAGQMPNAGAAPLAQCHARAVAPCTTAPGQHLAPPARPAVASKIEQPCYYQTSPPGCRPPPRPQTPPPAPRRCTYTCRSAAGVGGWGVGCTCAAGGLSCHACAGGVSGRRHAGRSCHAWAESACVIPAGGLGLALLLEVVGRRQWAVGRPGRATRALPLLGTAAPQHARCSCWVLPCAHCHTHPMCCKRTHLQAGPRAAAVLAQAQQAQRARRHASGAAGRAEEVALVLGKGVVAGAGREEGGAHEAREPLPRPGPGRLRRAGRALGCPAGRHLGGAP